MISHPTGAPVVVAPTAPAVAPAVGGGSYAAPAGGAVVVQQSAPWGWFWFIILLCVLGGLGLAYYFFKKSGEQAMEENEFDPLSFFYLVQQAAMDDDAAALRELCTDGMAMALSGHPEDGSARKLLTGITYVERNYGDTIEYKFRADGKAVCERWQIKRGKLEGIEVVEL